PAQFPSSVPGPPESDGNPTTQLNYTSEAEKRQQLTFCSGERMRTRKPLRGWENPLFELNRYHIPGCSNALVPLHFKRNRYRRWLLSAASKINGHRVL